MQEPKTCDLPLVDVPINYKFLIIIGVKIVFAKNKMLKELKLLTPGDFAAVRRQHRFNPISNATDLLERLMQECAVKEDAHKSVMGFL